MDKNKLERIVKTALHNGRDYSTLEEVKSIPGGSINEAFYVRTAKRSYFFKYHAKAPRRFFNSEAIGLRKIKETGTIAVPNYYAYSDQEGEAFLLLDWIAGEKTSETEGELGRKVAELHQCYGTMHGFRNDTYIGILPQPNDLKANWLAYYREYRLGSQMNQGIAQDTIKGKRRDRLEKLMFQLDKWIPSFVEPSHLHGDLYQGNWLVGSGGKPFLVDPSFLYGDRHFEIAFTEMFGGLPTAFYEAYEEVYPLRPDFSDIKAIYKLYYLLAHLNMFGETYGQEIDAILQYYVGDGNK